MNWYKSFHHRASQPATSSLWNSERIKIKHIIGFWYKMELNAINTERLVQLESQNPHKKTHQSVFFVEFAWYCFHLHNFETTNSQSADTTRCSNADKRLCTNCGCDSVSYCCTYSCVFKKRKSQWFQGKTATLYSLRRKSIHLFRFHFKVLWFSDLMCEQWCFILTTYWFKVHFSWSKYKSTRALMSYKVLQSERSLLKTRIQVLLVSVE